MITFAKPGHHFAHPLTAALLDIGVDSHPSLERRGVVTAASAAHAELTEDDARYLLELHMPGLGPEDVRLELLDRQLTVVGTNKQPRQEHAKDIDMDKPDADQNVTGDEVKSSEAGRPASPTTAMTNDNKQSDGSGHSHKTPPPRSIGEKERLYKRTMTVPRDVDEDKLIATMDKGILHVVMPKRLPERRQITVTSG